MLQPITNVSSVTASSCLARRQALSTSSCLGRGRTPSANCRTRRRARSNTACLTRRRAPSAPPTGTGRGQTQVTQAKGLLHSSARPTRRSREYRLRGRGVRRERIRRDIAMVVATFLSVLSRALTAEGPLELGIHDDVGRRVASRATEPELPENVSIYAGDPSGPE
jgi:hypothetical protein